MHLGDVVDHVLGAEIISHGISNAPFVQPLSDEVVGEPESTVLLLDKQDMEPVLTSNPPTPRSPATTTIPRSILKATEQAQLPEGYVTPVRQRRKLGPRSLRPGMDGRRKTLPVQFAPIALIPGNDESSEEEHVIVSEVVVEEPQPLSVQQKVVATTEPEGEWEDVQEEEEDSACVDDNSRAIINSGTHCEGSDRDSCTADMSMDDVKEQHDSTLAGQTSECSATASKVISSQRTDQHYDVVDLGARSRRSPRRKSSSPLKQSMVASMDRSHLIAFTPVKLPRLWLELSTQFVPDNVRAPSDDSPEILEDETSMDTTDATNPDLPAMLERSTSAPPEEAKLSPRKASKPRLSDDTALLQSFLKRAAESKSSRRLSVSDKESLTNRRDSDTVRRALASPAKVDVLTDLDPNSPSVRGSSDLASSVATDRHDLSTNEKAVGQVEDEIADTTQMTRRSGRGRQKPQVLAPMTYSAPSKISIRGNANVDLKRSEAQEKATLLKTNTRKNKFGAVSRMIRLTQLAAEQASGDSAEIVEADGTHHSLESNPRLRWAETLAVYFEAPEPEYSQVSDEAHEPTDTILLAEEADSKMDIDEDSAPAPTPVAPVDTPSKPRAKLRRLPARSSSAAGIAVAKSEALPETRVEVIAAEPKAKPPSTRRQSRIATPAKSLKSGTSLLPATDEAVVTRPVVAQQPTIPKKRAVPKMPASSTSSLVAVNGKENNNSSMLASPARKKSSAGATGAVRGPPTAKSFVPQLDFGSSLRLGAPSADVGTAGLMSPAKKGKGGTSMFASGASEKGAAGMAEGVHGNGTKLTSSPAKKRTRR
nr:hypothetical protein CFP56_37250 [Quercus suber]